MLTKDQLYLSRIMSAEYDLAGLINAYGPKAIHWLVDKLTEGDFANVDSFLSEAANYKFASTDIPRAKIVIIKPAKKAKKKVRA